MENKTKIFKSDTFGELQTIKSGEDVYFEATKCAALLGYPCTADCIYKFCVNAIKFTALNNIGRCCLKKFIPKEDLLILVNNSTSPIAGKFKEWVFEEIIPAYKEENKKQSKQLQKNTSGRENKSLCLTNPNSRFLKFLKKNNIEFDDNKTLLQLYERKLQSNASVSETNPQSRQTLEVFKFTDANGSCVEYSFASMPFQGGN